MNDEDDETRVERFHSRVMAEVLAQAELAKAEVLAERPDRHPFSDDETDIFKSGVLTGFAATVATFSAHGWLVIPPEEIA